MYFYISFKYA